VLSSKNLTAQAGMGVMYELDAIAMAVIGGVSLAGGRGSILGTVLGALIFGVIISGFTFLRLDAYYQEMVKGAIIVGAVVLDQWRQRRARTGHERGGAMSELRLHDMGDIILETRDLTKHYGGVHALDGRGLHPAKGRTRRDHGRQRGRASPPSCARSPGSNSPPAARSSSTAARALRGSDRRARSGDRDGVPEPRARRRSRRARQPFSRAREDQVQSRSVLDPRLPGMREATLAALQKTAVKIPNIRNTIRNMSGGQRQCVAIARTATFHSKLTIMDEPTAALGVQETAQVENIIRTLKGQGEPLILISHNMRQVFDLWTGSSCSGAGGSWRT
jgi:fructose transport system ATP-binding protein